jgi:hypothetical protein
MVKPLHRSVVLVATEAEFIAASEWSKELLWLKVCLQNLVEKVVRC